MANYVLTLTCDDRPGIVAAVASCLAKHGGNIVEAQQFDDHETGKFFMRVAFALESALDDFTAGLAEEKRRFGLTCFLRPTLQMRKVLILVSKFDHCMGDLLYRMRIGEMNMECVGIVSNHPKTSLNLTLQENIPFHDFPITKETKPEQEARIKTVVEETGAELVILARYMQILSDDLTEFLSGRCINIHHSFLPGFNGAKPYHQAHERGVKMIGATAHYVTADLDDRRCVGRDRWSST
ncbi:formyltetrahydrofolate deformylase [Amorphus sp. 3PC139-8]|uniref:formyltetrahydrofolate deformylase n=1 Tax=Amorphus sp. 3PC139-8 TaxID=2735676 RepID=UPI00345DF23B